MRVMVTGGAGFIGSHLCDALLGLSHEVIALDNLITGSRENIAHLAATPGFRFLERDVTQDLSDLEADAVFHLASPASPLGYTKYAIETMLVNSLGTLHVLELARRCRAPFLLASTSEAYGDPLEHPQRENYWGHVNPIGPRACYDEGKRFAEALTMNYLWKHDLDVRIVRIFNTYGPRYDPEDGRMVPNFVTQALSHQPITLHGDGLQTRSLCYVSDLVQGLLKAFFQAGTKGEVFNLGNEEEHTVLHYAELIKRLSGSPSPIVYQRAREEDPSRRRPDISKARQALGWEPRVGLDEGLERTIAWFRGRMAGVRIA